VGNRSDSGQEKKSGVVTEMVNDGAGDDLAEGSADPGRSADRGEMCWGHSL